MEKVNSSLNRYLNKIVWIFTYVQFESASDGNYLLKLFQPILLLHLADLTPKYILLKDILKTFLVPDLVF